MTHPLTDKFLAENYSPFWIIDIEEFVYCSRDMRAAYDLAIESMSQWIEENGHEYVVHYHDLGCQSNFSQMITDFKEAMRP